MRTPDILKEKFKEINTKYDILLTHDPVYSLGTTDRILEPKWSTQDPNIPVGDPVKFERLMELYDQGMMPKFVISGHIHSGNHNLELHHGTLCANVSLMDEFCDKLVYKPLVINWYHDDAGEHIEVI